MSAPTPDRIVIATRESRLALWQAEHVKARLEALYPSCTVELLGMTTRGDQILDRPLAKVGGKGLFVKELETALLDRAADIAVHSMKDVPMTLAPEFALVAIAEREVPLDAFVSNKYESLDDMPPGAVVGTSSLRREAQIHAQYPMLAVTSLRGNLDTRLRKLDEGQYDAIVLAAAGLKRLGLEARIRTTFEPSAMLPAAGQGALGIEVRSDRQDLIEPLRLADPQKLHRRDDHALRRIAPAVENALRERPVIDTDAQCDAPLAALGDQRLQLAVIRTVIARIDAHLVDILRGNGGHLGQEVDVGHDGRIEALVAQTADDAGKVLALAPPLCRKAHDLSPGAVDPFDLRHAGFGIVGVGVGHRLHGDRVPAADHDPPDAHLATRAATVFRKIHLFCDCDAKIKIIRDFANSDLFPIFRIATTIPLPP